LSHREKGNGIGLQRSDVGVYSLLIGASPSFIRPNYFSLRLLEDAFHPAVLEIDKAEVSNLRFRMIVESLTGFYLMCPVRLTGNSQNFRFRHPRLNRPFDGREVACRPVARNPRVYLVASEDNQRQSET